MSGSLTTCGQRLRQVTRSTGRVVRHEFVWMLALLALSCAGRKANFGTLPQVSVPIEREPEQDPTLFRDETDHELPPTTTDPPDPRPLRSRDQYVFVVEYQRGEVKVLSVKEVHLGKPASTVRRVGRFALELWTGQELVDRVRFDFPLLGASASGVEEDPLGSGLSARTKVRIPASARATRARILDRKTRKEVEIAWPPGLGDTQAEHEGSAAQGEAPDEPGEAPDEPDEAPDEQSQPHEKSPVERSEQPTSDAEPPTNSGRTSGS